MPPKIYLKTDKFQNAICILCCNLHRQSRLVCHAFHFKFPTANVSLYKYSLPSVFTKLPVSVQLSTSFFTATAYANINSVLYQIETTHQLLLLTAHLICLYYQLPRPASGINAQFMPSIHKNVALSIFYIRINDRRGLQRKVSGNLCTCTSVKAV